MFVRVKPLVFGERFCSGFLGLAFGLGRERRRADYSPQGGFKSAKELLDSAKANPGKINYASIGVGTPSQLATDLLAKRAGLQWVRVPLGNDVAALNDVMAGQVGFTVADLPSALPHIRAGKLQAGDGEVRGEIMPPWCRERCG